jgi:Bacterial Ig domain
MADFKRILGAVTTGALLALPLFASAQTRFVWGTRFNSTSNDYDSAAAAAVDATGNLITVGSTNSAATGLDILISKFTSKGYPAWSRSVSSSTTAANLSVSWGAGWEGGKAVDTDSQNGIWVGGQAYIAGGGFVAPLYKYDTKGNQKVAIVIGGTNNNSLASIVGIKVNADDSVLVAGYKGDTSKTTGFISKYDTAGTLLWTQNVGASASSSDVINGWTVDASGNIFVTGKTTTAGNADLFTAKLDSSAATVWFTKYSTDGTDYGNQVSLDSAGNVITLGQTNGKSKGLDYVVQKLNSSGVQQWAVAYDAQASRKDDIARNLLVGSDNSVYVTGSTVTTNTYFNTARFAGSNGALLQTNRLSIGSATTKPGLEQNADGTVALTLTTLTSGTPQLSIYTFKADLTAPVIERWQLSNGANSVQFIESGLVSGLRNVFAVGDNGAGATSSADISVIRIAPTALGVVKYNAAKNVLLSVDAASGLQKSNTIVGAGLTIATSKLTDPTSGAATVASNGSFTYLPNTDFLGVDTFNYKTVAGNWESDYRTAQVTTQVLSLKVVSIVGENTTNGLVVHVTLKNPSTTLTVGNVQVSSAAINTNVLPTSSLPVSVGSILPGQSATFDLTFAKRKAGKVAFKFGGTFDGDSFSIGTSFVCP